MRDFSYLRASRTTLEVAKHTPAQESACVNCGDTWRFHRQGNDDTACRVCTCDNFAVDTSGPPDEVQRISQWHYADSGEVVSDPTEIAELERRLVALGGANGRTQNGSQH